MPDWKQEILKRLVGLKLEPAREAEIVEELSQHLEDRYRELTARGITEDAARKAALSELGNGLAANVAPPFRAASGAGLASGTSATPEDAGLKPGATVPGELARGLRRVEAEMNQEPVIFGGETPPQPGGGNFFASFRQDVRYGLRQLRKNPGFTAVAVLTLALGIGANTAIFTVVNAVVLRPLPYAHSDRLMWITEYIPALKAHLVGGGDYVDWKDQNKTLEQIAAYDDSSSFNLTGRATPSRIRAAQVTASFFATMGVNPQLGRGFTSKEDQPNGRKVVVLMHSFWQQYFGSDTGVLNQTLTLDGAPYAVVGVMPASFKFPGEPETRMLLPLQLNEAGERLRQRQRLVSVFGLLKTGIAPARVAGDLDAIRKRGQEAAMQQAAANPPRGPAGGPAGEPGSMIRMQVNNQAAAPRGARVQARMQPPPGGAVRFRAGPGPAPMQGGAQPEQAMRRGGPMPQGKAAPQGAPQRAGSIPPGNRPTQMRVMAPPGVEMRVVPLAEHLAGNLRPAMLTMLGVVALVLLIACANVANLMLARASARTREVAVRAALGARRGRLVRQLLTESMVLALGGGAVGLVLALAGVGAMTRLIPTSLGGNILSVAPPHADWRVLSFAFGVSILTGVLFGLLPAISATRMDLVERLKDGVQKLSWGPGRAWLRGSLVVVELSLALVLLIGAGLLMKSFYRELTVDPGFAMQHVLTMNLSLTSSRYPTAQQRSEFFSQVLQRAASLPGVRSAAVSDSLPLHPYRGRMMMRREIMDQSGAPPKETLLQMAMLTVSPSYFYTLGIPVLKGRTFTERDDEQAPKVAVVNQTMAERLWPGEDPIGKPVPIMGGGTTVVGVVANSHHENMSENYEAEVYVPYLQSPRESMQLALRTSVDPTSLAPAMRREVAEIDPEQPIYDVTTLEQTLSDSVAPQRFDMLLLALFAAIALVLATVGIYGVMGYSVTQRTHEIGVRMALGAERNDVLKMVVGDGLKLTLIGTALGVAGAFALTRFLASFLFQVKPTDAFTFVFVSVVLAIVALLACYIPARRATRVDPVVALRYE